MSLTPVTKSIHNFKIKGLETGEIDFSKFKGKKILVVNTASKCGYTKQYKQLEELYQANKENLVVVGFPCNDFGGQEPGSAEEISDFCQKNFGVTFPLTEKVSVKGATKHPIYQFLTQEENNGVADVEVKWNFHKFLLDENGKLIASFASSVTPLDEEILSLLK